MQVRGQSRGLKRGIRLKYEVQLDEKFSRHKNSGPSLTVKADLVFVFGAVLCFYQLMVSYSSQRAKLH